MTLNTNYCYINKVAENDDQFAFKQLYLQFSPGLISYAHTLLRNRQLAEEVIEDVFLKVWLGRKMLPTINNLSYYLYTAAKHTALNYLKRQKKNSFVDLEEAADICCIQTPEGHSIQKENLQQIEAAINALPDKCRLVFRLVKEEKLKYREVAALLSVSPKTVEAHMRMAYTRIAERLEAIFPHTSLKKVTGC